ncbi:MAG TPA: ABC transporter substrate-binding protein [Candidatus Limnocylindrales bacterium]|nr:ABC transporter substrate-binding protein [Candidatus Limnocylindrales bacterium]
MPQSRPTRSAPTLAVALAVLALAAAACGGGAASTSVTATAAPAESAPSASAGAPSSGAPTPAPEPASLTVGLGYIPSVQFAQFYLAQQAGYYADAGLTVTLQNKIDPDLITLLGQGAVDIGSGDGTSVIPAVSQGIPVVYTATIYGQFPAVVVAKADSGITSAADLKGRKIGIPGRYGSSWIMLQALLQSAGLTVDDVEIVEFPDFGQATALQQGTVDAATGFANNEPIQLRKAGIEPVVLTVDDVVPLPGPGLVTGTKTLADKEDALRRFVAATLRAMDDIRADPQKGLDATFALVPDLAQDPELQRQILDATIAQWTNARTNAPYGSIDRDGWQRSLDFMGTLGLVPNPVTVDQLVSETLLAE